MALALVIAVSSVPVGTPASAALVIDGRRTTMLRDETLAMLLRRTGAGVPEGQVRAVVSGRVVGHRPGIAPRVSIDGRPGDLDSTLRAGDRVTLAPGSAVEHTAVAYVAAARRLAVGGVVDTMAPDAVPGADAGMPDVLHRLWRPGRAALRRVLVGSVSGELAADLGTVPATSAAEDRRPLVALTFDDGPDATWTPQVLAVLRQEDVRATFCVVGYAVRAHPELVVRERASGATLCDHTMSHDENLPLRPQATISSEIGQDAALVDQVSGVRPRFYRPPGGRLSPAVVGTALGLGMRVLFWTIDTDDYLRPPSAVLVQRVLDQVTPGSIILFHDGGGDRSRTVVALRPLIEALRRRGYGFVTLGAEGPPPPAAPPIDRLR